jgi:hypothetical protein
MRPRKDRSEMIACRLWVIRVGSGLSAFEALRT